MGLADNYKQKKLKSAFPKLTEANQQYMLGVALGLKHAQNNGVKKQQKGMKSGTTKTDS